MTDLDRFTMNEFWKESEVKQYIIRKQGDKWVVLTEDGSKVLGTHDTEEGAKKQLGAIEASKARAKKMEEEFGVQIDFEDVATISDVDIFAVGTWRGVNSPPEGDTYSTEDLNAMVEAFNAGVVKPKIKITHGSDKEQVDIGEVSNLRIVANKLIGDFVNVPKGLHELMKKGLFGKRSAEVIWDLKDKAGKVWKRVVKAVALLAPGQRPAVGALSDGYQFEALYCYEYPNDEEIEFHYEPFEPPEAGDAPEGVKGVLSSAYSSCRTSWVKDHPGDKENASNKTRCSKIAWAAVKNAGWHKTSKGWQKSHSDNSDTEDIKKMTLDELLKKYGVSTPEELNELLNQKIKELDEKDKRVAAYEDEKAKAREQRLREFVERMKKEGKILPKEEAGVLSYLTPLSVLEDQKPLEEAMKRIENESKKIDLEEKSRSTEQKYEVNAEASPQSEVNRLAQTYIADGKAKDYASAVEMVKTSHPELWKSYLARR